MAAANPGAICSLLDKTIAGMAGNGERKNGRAAAGVFARQGGSRTRETSRRDGPLAVADGQDVFFFQGCK